MTHLGQTELTRLNFRSFLSRNQSPKLCMSVMCLKSKSLFPANSGMHSKRIVDFRAPSVSLNYNFFAPTPPPPTKLPRTRVDFQSLQCAVTDF